SFINHPLTSVSLAERESLPKDITDKQLFEVDIDMITIASSVFPRFFKPLANPSALIRTLVHLLDSLLISLAAHDRTSQIDSNLRIETKIVSNQLKQAIVNIAPTSIAFQIRLIRKAIAPIYSAIEGDPLNALQIMALLDSRCLHF